MSRARWKFKKLSDVVAVVTVELLIVFVLFFISLVLLIMVIEDIFYDKSFTLDNRVFEWLSFHVSDTNTAVMKFMTFFGSQNFLIPAWLVVLAYFFFVRKNKWYFIKAITIALSNLVLMFGLKLLFNRHRPLIPLLKEVRGLSFPSGHAYMSFTFFAVLIYIVYRYVSNLWLKWITISFLIIFIFLVGLSRVYLRVHYASDVIAGYCFGMISLGVLLALLHQIEKFNKKKHLAPALETNEPVTKKDN